MEIRRKYEKNHEKTKGKREKPRESSWKTGLGRCLSRLCALRFAFNERSGGVRDAATSNWDMSGHLANLIWRRIGP